MNIVKRLDSQPEWEEILDGVVQPGGTIPEMDGAFLDSLLIQNGILILEGLKKWKTADNRRETAIVRTLDDKS